MRIAKIAVGAVGVLAGGLLIGGHALARTLPAEVGMAVSAADVGCFSDSFGGLVNTCATARSYVIGVPWDTATGAAKTLIVRKTGTVSSCSYVGTNSAGAVIASIAVTPGVATAIPSVPAGSFGRVFCSVGASSSGVLLGVDYFAP